MSASSISHDILLASFQHIRKSSSNPYASIVEALQRTDLDQFPLHKAIAQGLTDANTQHKLLSATPRVISQKVIKDLTPLALACMKENRVAIDILLKKNANLFEKDASGWTPFLYLQMNESQCLDQARTYLTPNQQHVSTLFDRITHPSTNDQLSALDLGEEAKGLPTADAFEQLTLATYHDFPSIPKTALREHWESRYFSRRKNNLGWPVSEDSISAFLKHPPALTLKRNSLGMLQPCAKELIKAGTIIRILSGEIDTKSLSSGIYSSSEPWWIRDALNSTHFKNEGNLVRHGFPNCSILSTEQFGIPLEVLVATEEIAPNTPLQTLLPERHPHRQLPPIFEEQEAIIEAFNKMPPLSMTKRINDLRDEQYKPAAQIEQRRLEEKLNYLIESPQTLVLLFLKAGMHRDAIVKNSYLKQHRQYKEVCELLNHLTKIKDHYKNERTDPFVNWLYLVPVHLVPTTIKMFAERLETDRRPIQEILSDLNEAYLSSTTMVRYLAGEDGLPAALQDLHLLTKYDNPTIEAELGCLELFARIGKAGDAQTTSRMNKLQTAFYFDHVRKGQPLTGQALASIISLADEEIQEIQEEIDHPDEKLNAELLEQGRKIRNELFAWVPQNDPHVPIDKLMDGLDDRARLGLSNGIHTFLDIHHPDRKKQFALDFAAYSLEKWDGTRRSLTPSLRAAFCPSTVEYHRPIATHLLVTFEKTPNALKALNLINFINEP